VVVWGRHSCPPAARQIGAFASGSLIQANREKMRLLAAFETLSEVEGVGTMQPAAPLLISGGTTTRTIRSDGGVQPQRRLPHRSIAHMIYMVVRWRGIGNQWNAVLRTNWSNICRTFGALRRRRAFPRSKRLRPHGLSALPSLW
jgi:hypothetical protein